MRLIDADKLKKELEENKTSYEISDVDERQNEVIDWCIKDVDNAQTIEAIPVEWVVNWLTRQHIPATHTCDDYYAVEMMLDDWRKENGN